MYSRRPSFWSCLTKGHLCSVHPHLIHPTIKTPEYASLSRLSFILFQDLFFHVHPVHFLNSRAHGIGVGRSQSPTRERDNIFGFRTGSRRVSELPSSGEAPLPWEQNMYVSEPNTDGHLENLLEHAQDVSLWVAVEICSASSIKVIKARFKRRANAVPD